ncbi:MAG: hypothetical protein E6G90_17815 [Alphaproteobacteria bacterium]|nr:MAG: hypothetical protein E6G90_17815 [Alphaproteobacteria bacterium]
MDQFVPVAGAELAAVKTEDVDQPRRRPQHVALNIPFVDAFSDGLADQPVALLARAQFGLAAG